MQVENAVAVDAGLAPHANAVGFRLQSALVGALQDSFPLRLGDCRKDGYHHPSHGSFSSDAVVQEAHGHAVLVELLDQPESCQQCCVLAGQVSGPVLRRHFPPSVAVC